MPSLRELAVGDMCGSEFVKGVLVQSKSRLEVLRIGMMYSRDHSKIAPAFSNVADSLIELEISDPFVVPSRAGVVTEAVEKLIKIETLSLGSQLVNFDALFFRILPSLHTLRNLTITCDYANTHPGARVRNPSSLSVAEYLSSSPCQLKSLSVTAPLIKSWTPEELKAVSDAADVAGIRWTVDL